ncbi:MAG: Ig-like domain-containing protein [Clostridia bacterium]|nr:Ig-like domain-containing protein [Clostridia bacterium]
MEKTKTSNDVKSKILTAVVVVFLCLVFVVGFIYGLNSVLAMEGSYPPEEDTHGVYDEPKTSDDVAALLNKVFGDALENKPKAFVEDEFSIDGNSIVMNGSEELKKTVLFAKDKFTSALSENTPAIETDFSENLPVKAPQITGADIESFECNYFARDYIYQCDNCGKESDELIDGCPECESPNFYSQQGRSEYVISAILKCSDDVINANFAKRTDSEIRSLFGDEFDKAADIGKIDVTNDNMEVYFRINRNTGELLYLEFKKDMTVKADAVFKGNLASLGKTDIEFKLTEKAKNSFTWPSLMLSDESMIIEPKNTDNLTATLTCSDPLKPVVTWKTSDENVVTVDDEGYLKAGKDAGEAKITASFDFLGKTYTDTCDVSVRVPVESMAISKRHVKLDTGETKQLDAKVSPKDATVQTKKWYSDDESIAVVDENGVVTAVKSGVVTVYALSDDGFYKSTCEVTVK